MKYQITFLIKDVKDKEVVLQAITSIGGKILAERVLGERKLSYPIRKQLEAIFVTQQFELDPQKLVQLDHALRFQVAVLRFIIITTQYMIKPMAEVPAMIAEPAVIAPAPTVPTPGPKPVDEKPQVPKNIIIKLKNKPKPQVSESKRLKALDEKLKELLQE